MDFVRSIGEVSSTVIRVHITRNRVVGIPGSWDLGLIIGLGVDAGIDSGPPRLMSGPMLLSWTAERLIGSVTGVRKTAPCIYAAGLRSTENVTTPYHWGPWWVVDRDNYNFSMFA